MFSDLKKWTDTLDGLVQFFGWTEAPTPAAKRWREVISSVVLGYAVGLCHGAGWSKDEVVKLFEEAWSHATGEKTHDG